MSVYSSRLQQLRQVMQQAGVDAYVVFSSDPHLSEYLPDYYQGRAWLSGFTGSAGSVVVTADFAGVWTDSRYWVQAEQDLQDSGFELMRWGHPETPDMLDWVAQHLQEGQVIAYDGQVVALAQARAWQAMATQHQFVLDENKDLLSLVWKDRPCLPTAPIYVHEAPFCQRGLSANLHAVQQRIQALGASAHLISSLDDIAWLFNLRGSDVDYNPIFLAHALIFSDQALLFVDEAKITEAVRAYLAQAPVTLMPYDQLALTLQALPSSMPVLIAPNAVTVGTLAAAPQVCWVEAPNPSTLLKACKTPAEIQHVRDTMEADGAALCQFFTWFEQTIQQRPITELEVDEQLTAARARQPHFVSPSFGTIAAFGANGAMPHYQATLDSYSIIQGDGLLLIDSGGQYLGGTTDITRVIPVGNITPEQKRDYTLVLKGMIALSQAVFAKGISGQQLDVLARMPLWQAGLDFGHGTGHGVGYFMNVHEGPQSISWRTRPGNQPQAMLPGMITSNEPGLYRAGQWGIRIENLIVCVEHLCNEFAELYAFETLTLCPIDTRCIDTTLLNSSEITWLNQYHQQVFERLAPRLDGAALAWLTQATRPLATTNCSN